jgi:hypothetical protein
MVMVKKHEKGLPFFKRVKFRVYDALDIMSQEDFDHFYDDLINALNAFEKYTKRQTVLNKLIANRLHIKDDEDNDRGMIQ